MGFHQGIHDKIKIETVRDIPSGYALYIKHKNMYDALPINDAVPLWGELLTCAQRLNTATANMEKDDPWLAKNRLPTTDKEINEIHAYRLDWAIDGDKFRDVFESYAYAVTNHDRLTKGKR